MYSDFASRFFANNESARSKYLRPITGHKNALDFCSSCLFICVATSASVKIFRSAFAIAEESFCCTSTPEPSLSISDAWGKSVAMIGFPATAASTSTPDVTCSIESYGNTMTSADAMSSSSSPSVRYLSMNLTLS